MIGCLCARCSIKVHAQCRDVQLSSWSYDLTLRYSVCLDKLCRMAGLVRGMILGIQYRLVTEYSVYGDEAEWAGS